MSLDSWLVFVAIWILAGIPLGPNALNCISTSVTEGFKKSLLCIVGILMAAMLFIVAVSSGLSAILLANAEIFTFIKVIGAAYLIWMGIKMWNKRSGNFDISPKNQSNNFQIVKDSFLISITNPKAILSYAAVFSQFIDQNQSLDLQLIILASTALLIVGLIYLGYCWCGLAVAQFLNTPKRLVVFNKSIGTAYIAGGAALLGYEPGDSRSLK